MRYLHINVLEVMHTGTENLNLTFFLTLFHLVLLSIDYGVAVSSVYPRNRFTSRRISYLMPSAPFASMTT